MGRTVLYPTRQQEAEKLYTRPVNGQSTSLIHNTFHISKIKPYVENDSANFPGHQEEQPSEVTDGRWEVE